MQHNHTYPCSLLQLSHILETCALANFMSYFWITHEDRSAAHMCVGVRPSTGTWES